jgi:hypothetical protein
LRRLLSPPTFDLSLPTCKELSSLKMSDYGDEEMEESLCEKALAWEEGDLETLQELM